MGIKGRARHFTLGLFTISLSSLCATGCGLLAGEAAAAAALRGIGAAELAGAAALRGIGAAELASAAALRGIGTAELASLRATAVSAGLSATEITQLRAAIVAGRFGAAELAGLRVAALARGIGEAEIASLRAAGLTAADLAELRLADPMTVHEGLLTARGGVGALVRRGEFPTGTVRLLSESGEARGLVELIGRRATLWDAARTTEIAVAEILGPDTIVYRSASGRVLGRSRVLSETVVHHYLGPDAHFVGYDLYSPGQRLVRHFDRLGVELPETTRLVGLGATIADAAAAAGAALAGAAVVSERSPQPAGVRVRAQGCDDACAVIVNGKTILVAEFGDDSGPMDLTPLMRRGTNTIQLVVLNYGGAITYSFQVLVDGQLIYDRACGTARVVGCQNGRQYPIGNFRIGELTVQR